ncbi:MAG: YlxR family protein [Oscillospiraceae bacterium]|nr:YlxR family protein [Oscillospiraceae bacterium]
MPEKRVPLRKCVGCGEMIGKKEAVRIVRDKDGNISIDPTGKKSGRGAYICKDKSCLEQAQKGKKLERSFKCQIPAEIYETIEKELTSDK